LLTIILMPMAKRITLTRRTTMRTTRRTTGGMTAAVDGGRHCRRHRHCRPDTLAVDQRICRHAAPLILDNAGAVTVVVFIDDVSIPSFRSPVAAIFHAASLLSSPVSDNHEKDR